MMGSFLTKLRRKPKHVKDNIAFGSAAAITLTICAVWFVAGPLNTKEPSTREASPRAFSTLLDQVKDQFASVKESLPKAETSPAESGQPQVATATTTFINALSTSSAPDLASSPKEVTIVAVSRTGSTSTSSNTGISR